MVGIRAAIGIDVLPFVTQAEFVAPGAGGVFFQQEQTVVAGQRLRHVGLLAEGFEVATQGLCPEHAAPAEQRLMGQLQAGIGGVVVEASAHFPAFDLLVLVIAVADTQPCQFKARQRIAQLAAQIPALLPHVDVGHAAVFVVVIMVVVIVIVAAAMPIAAVGVAIGVLVGQQPVAVVLLTVGGADVAPLADEAGAQVEAVGVVVGAFLLVRRAGDFIGVGLTLGTLGADGEVAAAGSDTEHPGTFVGDAVGA